MEKAKWWYGGVYSDGKFIAADKETCSKRISSGKKCSCPFCCGNHRRVRGRNYITRQELKAGIKGRMIG